MMASMFLGARWAGECSSVKLASDVTNASRIIAFSSTAVMWIAYLGRMRPELVRAGPNREVRSRLAVDADATACGRTAELLAMAE